MKERKEKDKKERKGQKRKEEDKGISYYRGLMAMGDGPVPDLAGLTLDQGRAGKDVIPRLKEEN